MTSARLALVQWVLTKTSEDMESFFRPVIADIVECIDSQWTTKTKALIIAGGFSRSKYLTNYLRNYYKGKFSIPETATKESET